MIQKSTTKKDDGNWLYFLKKSFILIVIVCFAIGCIPKQSMDSNYSEHSFELKNKDLYETLELIWKYENTNSDSLEFYSKILLNETKVPYAFEIGEFYRLLASVSKSDSDEEIKELELLYEKLKKIKELEFLRLKIDMSLLTYYHSKGDSVKTKERFNLTSEYSSKQSHLLSFQNCSFWFSLIVMLYILSLMFRRQTLLNKLKKKNEELNYSIEMLNLKEKQLNDSNLTLELLLLKRNKVINRLRQFSSVLAHDFKEPILTINSFGNLLYRKSSSKLTEEEDDLFQLIMDSSSRLNSMVNRLNQFSSNTIVLMNEFEEVNLNEIVNSVLIDLNLLIAEHKVKVSLDDLCTTLGDKVMLYTLFKNLISNSIKYRHETEDPIIEIRSLKKDNIDIISIKDNGRGLDKKEIGNIFSLFSRSESVKYYDRRGIGLAICKEVVEIHDGEIWVDSKLGEGSTFSFSVECKNEQYT